jgi:hypothetical protein
MLRNGCQNVLTQAGEYACYYLCLCRAACKDFNLDDVKALADKGLLLEDFTVQNAGDIMSYLTGQKWKHYKAGPDFKPKGDDIVIYEWFNRTTGRNHFRMRDFDSLANSITVRDGAVISTRVLCRV